MTKSRLSRSSSLAADIDRANQWREPIREPPEPRTRTPPPFRDARRRFDVFDVESCKLNRSSRSSSSGGNFSQSLSQTGDVVTAIIRGSVVADNRHYDYYDCSSSISAMASPRPRSTNTPPLLLARNPARASDANSLKMITDCAYYYSREHDTELSETDSSTEESNSYPAEVYVTEEMESKDLAQSRFLVGRNSVLLLFIGALIGWIFSRMIYHENENEQPGRLPIAAAEIPKQNGGPQWRDWQGSSYLDAVTTCSNSNFRSPCPYQAYCPGVRPQSDYVTAEQGVFFAPIVADSSLGWQWIRFGPGSGEDSCSLRHQSSFDESRDTITPQILCCEEEPDEQVLANLPDMIEPSHNMNPVKVVKEAVVEELDTEQDWEGLSRVWIDSFHGWEGK